MALVALACAAAPMLAQFASTTEIVEVYATVTDKKGRPVTGLTADSFRVFEEGAAQPVRVFAAGEFPLAVALAIDRSFSMGTRGVDTARAGARRLVDQLRARDRLLILAIGDGVETVSALDSPRESARQALDSIAPWGSSPIGDTVALAVEAFGGQRGRKAVVLWSDGAEREAQRATADVVEQVRRADVLVYSVAMARTVSPLLSELAAVSGGRVLQARDRKGAEAAAGLIAAELRHQYLLGYAPPPGPSGWRRIEVLVTPPGLAVRARQGYVAAAPADKASSEAPPASNQ